MDRSLTLAEKTWELLAYILCETAFKTDCRGPFAWAYREGCRCYDRAYKLSSRYHRDA